DVRRAKLYYLRDRSGKSARIKEKLPARGAAKKEAKKEEVKKKEVKKKEVKKEEAPKKE
ncbi:MAG: 50S ribosomal protein L19, partial [Nitrosomonadaceae bacterium]|nr:50S ribosomal protein L19 [Nitrosomonadaceae bacterium]